MLSHKEENVFYCDLQLPYLRVSPAQELLTMSPFYLAPRQNILSCPFSFTQISNCFRRPLLHDCYALYLYISAF